jgi:hypothetical protein
VTQYIVSIIINSVKKIMESCFVANGSIKWPFGHVLLPFLFGQVILQNQVLWGIRILTHRTEMQQGPAEPLPHLIS